MNTPPKVDHQKSIVHEKATVLPYTGWSLTPTHTNTDQHAASAHRQAVRPASPPLQRQQANMRADTERMSCELRPMHLPALPHLRTGAGGGEMLLGALWRRLSEWGTRGIV